VATTTITTTATTQASVMTTNRVTVATTTTMILRMAMKAVAIRQLQQFIQQDFYFYILTVFIPSKNLHGFIQNF
jgi:hypothetical protein